MKSWLLGRLVPSGVVIGLSDCGRIGFTIRVRVRSIDHDGIRFAPGRARIRGVAQVESLTLHWCGVKMDLPCPGLPRVFDGEAVIISSVRIGLGL